MRQNLLKYLAICCVGVAVFAYFANRAQANTLNHAHLQPDGSDSVVLSDLLNGVFEGVVVGDKIFSEFFYSTLPNDDMPEPEDVKVLGFQDEFDNLGISIQGVFWDLPGGGPSDALLRYTVEVAPEELAEGFRISDAHLFLGGIGVGENSFLAVDESFQGINQTLNTFATTLGEPSSQVLFDEVIFGQLHTKLRVTKDILAFSGSTNLPAVTSVIDQSFSQMIIPEPASLVIFAMFGLGLATARRRPPRRDIGS